MIGQSKNEKTIKSYLLHSFLVGVMFCYAFCQLQQTMKNVGVKPFYWAKTTCFDFYSINFNLQGHVLNTTKYAFC